MLPWIPWRHPYAAERQSLSQQDSGSVDQVSEFGPTVMFRSAESPPARTPRPVYGGCGGGGRRSVYHGEPAIADATIKIRSSRGPWTAELVNVVSPRWIDSRLVSANPQRRRTAIGYEL